MNSPRRRALLGTVGLTALAGCTQNGRRTTDRKTTKRCVSSATTSSDSTRVDDLFVHNDGSADDDSLPNTDAVVRIRDDGIEFARNECDATAVPERGAVPASEYLMREYLTRTTG